MEPNNIIKFELYRYQINPVKKKQLKLFGETISFKELKERKNEIFANSILEKESQKINGKGFYILRKYYNEKNMYMYKLASKKELSHHTRELESEVIDDYPYIHLMINNEPQSQTIAISKNYKAFNSTEIVSNILESYFENVLKNNELTFSITPILDNFEYWNVIRKYENRIIQIRFDIIRPNITNLSKALKESVKQLASTTNSHKTRIELNSPDKQTLEDINEENDQISALSEYSINGGGEVSLKVKGLSSRVKTSKSIRTIEIDSIGVKGNPKDVAEFMNKITKK